MIRKILSKFSREEKKVASKGGKDVFIENLELMERSVKEQVPREVTKIVPTCSTCSEIKKFKAKKLDELQKALNDVPANARFSGFTIVEEEGEIDLRIVTTKAEALALIKSAREGKLRLVF